jgi:hypothetical protein
MDEAVKFSNIAATPAAFPLRGGRYGVSVIGTFDDDPAGAVTLQMLGADGTTYQTVAAGTTFAASGYAVVELPPGQFQLLVADVTALYAQIVRIPQ